MTRTAVIHECDICGKEIRVDDKQDSLVLSDPMASVDLSSLVGLTHYREVCQKCRSTIVKCVRSLEPFRAKDSTDE